MVAIIFCCGIVNLACADVHTYRIPSDGSKPSFTSSKSVKNSFNKEDLKNGVNKYETKGLSEAVNKKADQAKIQQSVYPAAASNSNVKQVTKTGQQNSQNINKEVQKIFSLDAKTGRQNSQSGIKKIDYSGKDNYKEKELNNYNYNVRIKSQKTNDEIISPVVKIEQQNGVNNYMRLKDLKSMLEDEKDSWYIVDKKGNHTFYIEDKKLGTIKAADIKEALGSK